MIFKRFICSASFCLSRKNSLFSTQHFLISADNIYVTSITFTSAPLPPAFPVAVARTLGVEWEFSAPMFSCAPGGDSFVEEYLRREHCLSAFRESGFRGLFSVYGQDEDGSLKQWLIPRRVADAKGFEKIIARHGELFFSSGAKVFMRDWTTWGNADDFPDVLNSLMNAKGEDGLDLVICRNPEAWRGMDSELDRMIPDELAEEWRRGKFLEVEFPMNGCVRQRSDILAYVRNLWLRLGLAKAGDERLQPAIEKANGHVHWVLDIGQVPREFRQRVYSAIVAYWGDANDRALVRGFSSSWKKIKWLEKSILYKIGLDIVASQADQYSIGTLTRDVYKSVETTPDGILVRDSDGHAQELSPLETQYIYKRLFFGLRWKYGPPVPAGLPASIIGIEARNMPSIIANMAALPPDAADGESADMAALVLKHDSSGARGLVCSSALLQQLAIQSGVDPRIVEDIDRAFQALPPSLNPNRGCGLEQARALFLIPLNDWLNHPLVMHNMSKISQPEREAFQRRYAEATRNYARRINALEQARQNQWLEYQPEWDEPLDPFPDGINRVFSRKTYPVLSRPGETVADPNFLFATIVVIEAARFVSESGISEMMEM